MHTNMYFVKFFSCTILAMILVGQDTTAEQTYCGPALYDILDNICINGYQKMVLPTKKRSQLPHLGLEGGESDNGIQPAAPFAGSSMFMGKMYGGIANVMAKTRRRRHGVYDECCRKGCTFNELDSYCFPMDSK